MCKQCNCHHQVQTQWPWFSQPTQQVGASILLGSITQGAWLDTSISIYPDSSGLQGQVWKGANTPPGIESLSVYLQA